MQFIPERKVFMTAILKDFYNNVIRKKIYWIPLLFFTWASYGFSMMNRTISIDDLITPYYVDGQVWLSEYRWGAVLWKKLFSFGECTPYIDKFLSVHLMMAAATLACCSIYYLNGRKKNPWLYTIPACLMVTYPLINEIWEYTCGATIVVPGDFLLVGTAILYQLTRPRRTWKSLLLTTLILTQVVCSAESQACVYVTSVMLLIFYRFCVQEGEKGKKLAWLTEGLWMAAPLAAAVVLRSVLGRVLLAVLGLERTFRGATDIAWPLTYKELVLLLRQMTDLYIVRALVYFPIGIFLAFVLLFAVIVIALTIRKKSGLVLFLGIFTGVSLFTLMLIQGAPLPYRTAVNFTPFIGFTCYLLLDWILSLKKQTLARIAIVLMLWLCWRQAAYLHKLLALNNQRSDNEAAVMQQIGYRLVSEYPGRKVLLFGDYYAGDIIHDQIIARDDTWNGHLYYQIRERVLPGKTGRDQRYLDTNVCDTMDFYHEQFEAKLMKAFFSYYGYEIDYWDDISDEHRTEIWQKARAHGMNAFEIWDAGECVVVVTADLHEDN